MRFPFFVAWKYFNAGKKKHFIQIITWFAIGGVAVGTMALIIAISVINGLKENVKELYSDFDPDLKVLPLEGRYFEGSDSLLLVMDKVEGIGAVTPFLEDNVLIKHRENQMIAKVRGVSDNYEQQNNMQDYLLAGGMELRRGNDNLIIMGRNMRTALRVSTEHQYEAITLFYPRNIKAGIANPTNFYRTKNVLAGGVISLAQQPSEAYSLVPLALAEKLFDAEGKVSGFEIAAAEGMSVDDLQEALRETLGASYLVLNNEEQHASMLRAFQIEKIFIFIVFSFILAVSSFNIIFSLTMLVIEKKKDIAVLMALGATKNTVSSIFLGEGIIIAGLGTLVGLVVGLTLCLLQQEFGLVGMGMQSSMINAYPVKVEALDILYIVVAISLITFLAAIRPARLAKKIKVAEHL